MLLAVSAPTLPELFQNAAQQLLDLLINPAEIGEALQEKVVVEGEDMSSLLEAWMNALLGLVRDQQILPKRLSQPRIDTIPGKPYSLRVDVVGELLDPQRHTFRKGPKTLHITKTVLEN